MSTGGKKSIQGKDRIRTVDEGGKGQFGTQSSTPAPAAAAEPAVAEPEAAEPSEEEAEAPAKRVKADDDEDDDELDPDDVEADLDTILKDRIAAGDDEEEEECEDEPELITAYPGDVTNIFHTVADNRVLVAWQSKFCRSGFPGYSLDDTVKDEVAGYLGIDNAADLYLQDLFVVGGSTRSALEGQVWGGERDAVLFYLLDAQ